MRMAAREHLAVGTCIDFSIRISLIISDYLRIGRGDLNSQCDVPGTFLRQHQNNPHNRILAKDQVYIPLRAWENENKSQTKRQYLTNEEQPNFIYFKHVY